MTGFTPEQKLLVDEACIGWAGRGYLFGMNMSDYLKEFYTYKGIFLSIDQFKVALKDAGRRELIVKEKRRWRKPDK